MTLDFTFTDGAFVRTTDGKEYAADEVEIYDKYIICIMRNGGGYKYFNQNYVRSVTGKERR